MNRLIQKRKAGRVGVQDSTDECLVDIFVGSRSTSTWAIFIAQATLISKGFTHPGTARGEAKHRSGRSHIASPGKFARHSRI